MEGKNPHVLLAPTIDDPSPRAFNAKVYLSSRLYVMLPINEARDWSSYVLSVPPYGLTAAAPQIVVMKVVCGYALGIYPESRLSQLAVFAAYSGRDLM